jgi:membrane protein
MRGKRKEGSLFGMFKEAGSDFMEDRALRLSAAMAYYAVFALGPLLFLIIGVAGLIMGEEAVHREVSAQLKSLMGEQSTGMIESMMSARESGGSMLATIVGGIGLILGASGVFGQLQDALNTIWEVKAKPSSGIWYFLRSRFLSMGMVLGIGFLLLLSMALTTVVHAASGAISNWIEMPEWVAQGLNMVAAFAVITLLFAAIFKFLPDVKIRWSDVWIGALGTALLYTLGKFILGWYLGRESTASAYGAGGAFIIILLYIYYSSVILFFGAEFTQVYARCHGSRIEPSEHAVRVTKDERAQQGMPDREETSEKPAGTKKRSARTEAHAAPAYAAATHKTPGFMKRKLEPTAVRVHHGPAPLEQVRARPLSFVGLALTAGVAAGLLLKVRTLRKALKWYLVARRLV